jgi:hypothetical protein
VTNTRFSTAPPIGLPPGQARAQGYNDLTANT